MPGRRSPRKVRESMQSSHANSVFLGGLDGASSAPSPVTARWLDDDRTQCSEVFFFNDQFDLVNGGQQALILVFVPIPNSEHVYLVRADQGGYQTEITTWTREVGSKAIKVLPTMDARAGDKIVVEYAYYAQGPVPPCGSSFPLVVVPSPAVYDGEVIADGFPVIESANPNPNYPLTGTDVWVAFGLSYGDEDILDVGPGLAPGSSRSRRHRVLGNYADGSDMWMEADLDISAGYTSPRWGTANVIKFSTYYSISNVMTPSGDDEMGFHLYSSSDVGPVDINLRWNIVEGWVLEADCAGEYTPISFSLGSWSGVTPIDPGTHYIEVSLDITASTLSARFDSLVFKQTVPGIWFPKELTDVAQMYQHYQSGDDIRIEFWVYQKMADGGAPMDFCVDQTTLQTDVAYCQWGYYVLPGPVVPTTTWSTPGQVWWRMDQRLPINEGTAAPSGNATQYTTYAYPVVTTSIAPGSTAALRANGSGSNWCFLKGNNIVAPPTGPKTLAAEFWTKGPGELWFSAYPMIGGSSPGSSLFSLYVQYGGAPYDNAIAFMDAEASPFMRISLPLPPGKAHHIKGRMQAVPTWPPYPHPFEEKATYMLTLSLDVDGTAVTQTGPVHGTWRANESTSTGCSFLFRNNTIVVDEFRFGWE